MLVGNDRGELGDLTQAVPHLGEDFPGDVRVGLHVDVDRLVPPAVVRCDVPMRTVPLR